MIMRGLFSSLSTCYIECTSFTGLHGLCRLTHELQIDTVTFHIRKNRLFLLKSTIRFVLFWLNMAKRDSQRDVNILSQENAFRNWTCFEESDTILLEQIHNPGWQTKEARILQTASTDARLPNSGKKFPYYERICCLN